MGRNNERNIKKHNDKLHKEQDKAKAKKVYENLQPLLPEDVADAIYWAATRPPHVNINDIIIMPSIQASATNVLRKTNA